MNIPWSTSFKLFVKTLNTSKPSYIHESFIRAISEIPITAFNKTSQVMVFFVCLSFFHSRCFNVIGLLCFSVSKTSYSPSSNTDSNTNLQVCIPYAHKNGHQQIQHILAWSSSDQVYPKTSECSLAFLIQCCHLCTHHMNCVNHLLYDWPFPYGQSLNS